MQSKFEREVAKNTDPEYYAPIAGAVVYQITVFFSKYSAREICGCSPIVLLCEVINPRI